MFYTFSIYLLKTLTILLYNSYIYILSKNNCINNILGFINRKKVN